MTTNENVLPTDGATTTPIDTHTPDVDITPMDNHAAGEPIKPVKPLDNHAAGEDIVTMDNHAAGGGL
ncbi:hypothetical protein [Streptomyces sp. TBY4]|uniref:hypothetical protein n=1 Tax=Streptomyces sp. TBY4 TaxID=2962030 RepID=UPI0020B740B8|nr:hypothetical protein [Streptomyces sp. TBY4]MCP3759585.1 hypothetical protein [Streptomyces sp. TBY4]